MKVTKLYIEDYKMFKKFEMNFMDKDEKPLPIIVIAGINGSGKTTLLSYILKGSYVDLDSTHRNNNIEFTRNDKKLTLNNEAKKERQEMEDSKNTQLQEKGYARIHYSDNGLFLEDLNDHIAYIKAIDNDTQDIKKNILEYYRQKSREYDSHSKALEHIQLFIKDNFYGLDLTFNIDDINDVVRDKEEVFFKNLSGDTFPIEKLSTGEKTLLSKILNLYFRHIENKIILIDEPELSLHPSWQNRVLKLYENFAIKNNCQIIMATHSPHIIGSAKPEYLRVLNKDRNGNIKVLDSFTKSYGLEFNQVLRNIMDVQDTRTPEIAKGINRLWKLLENEEYVNKEYINLYNKLENILGDLDEDLILARLEVAKIKSQNA